MPEQLTTLRDMIQSARAGGVTFRQLESRAIDDETGRSASRAVFMDIVHGKTDRVPYDYHLRAIAAALGKPYEVVRQAAITQWIPPEEERQARKAAAREEISDLLVEARRLLERADELGRRGPGSDRESA